MRVRDLEEWRKLLVLIMISAQALLLAGWFRASHDVYEGVPVGPRVLAFCRRCRALDSSIAWTCCREDLCRKVLTAQNTAI